MRRRIATYLREQHLALLALFLVVSGGTAYALDGSDTVLSDDIVDGQVKTADVQDDGLRSVDVRDDTLAAGGLEAVDLAAGSVRSSELADNGIHSADVRDDTLTGGGLTAADLGAGSVGPSEVVDNSLGGAEIDESSLGTVPAAIIGGSGVSTVNHPGCSPAGDTYVDCGYVTRTLPISTRVLITASGTSGSSGSEQGFCRLATSQASLDDTYSYISDESNWGLTTVVGPIGPGTIDFGVECQKTGTNSVGYGEIQVAAVVLGPG